jgi:hypothetical protein
MDTADAQDQALLAKLDRLNALVHARDPAIVDELWSDLGFRLVGSEVGEIDETRDELVAHMATLFAKPFRVSWAWGQRKVTRHGDLAWVFADSEIVIASSRSDGAQALYRVRLFQSGMARLGESQRLRARELSQRDSSWPPLQSALFGPARHVSGA